MKVAIIMGSSSDKEVAKKVALKLNEFDIPWEMKVISAHRTPYQAIEYAENAEKNGIDIIIALAGKAAHLAGVLAGVTSKPVIGVPIKTSFMGGLDSLLSVVQMPKGVPVATVAVDGGENAGILAAQMLALKDEKLAEKLVDFKKSLAEDVDLMNREIDEFREDLR